jgi:hypothetical protein
MTVPSRPVSGAPAAATPAAVLERIRQLDERQKATTTQLALLQQRNAVEQSSESFGPLATGAVGALALGFRAGDLFSPAITHALPVAQLLLASRGRAISAGFRANPWSTLGFPAAALLLTAFREKIPGLGPTIVGQPDFQITPETSGGTFLVSARKPQGSILRFTSTLTGTPADPGVGDAEFPGVVRLDPGAQLKLRAFIGTAGSDVVTVIAPPATS